MTGGLIQLAIYGSQDIFLTGTPQITFFKIVYRRFTNFAIEAIQQEFIGETNFATETSCVIDKIGDLMNRVYLEIVLPSVDLKKNPANNSIDRIVAQQEFTDVQQYYNLVSEYIKTDTDYIRKLALMIRTNNLPMADIEAVMYDPDYISPLRIQRENLKQYILTSDAFNSIAELRDLKLPLVNQINRFDIQILFNAVIQNIDRFERNVSIEERNLMKRQALARLITKSIYSEMQDFYMVAYNIFLQKQKVIQAFNDGTYEERYKFAWVEEIGHAIIDQLDLKIGNELIDRQTGDWMILFNNIAIDEYQKKNYEKMIGQVPELITFDDQIKPEYKLVIPLQFYFCRHNGLSIPLVALRYHDVQINLTTKDLSRLCYVEDNINLLDIPNIQSRYGINLISARLFVDYIFLDSDERRRFAQATHEYLIEIVQYNDFTDILGKQYNAHLTYAHPTKFLIWFCQPNQYRTNPTGRNKCQWNNFGTHPDKTGYTLSSTFIRINTYELTDTSQDVIYFNYVQPYQYFNHSPTDGEYVYSFGIKPLEHQPSATVNCSRLDDLGLNLVFSDEFLALVNSNTVSEPGIYIGAYVMSYNIMRFMSGMGGLAFQTST